MRTIRGLRRNHAEPTTVDDWDDLSVALGLPRPENWHDGWNAIARRVGLPELTGADTVTHEEWNYAVDFATRLHA